MIFSENRCPLFGDHALATALRTLTSSHCAAPRSAAPGPGCRLPGLGGCRTHLGQRAQRLRGPDLLPDQTDVEASLAARLDGLELRPGGAAQLGLARRQLELGLVRNEEETLHISRLRQRLDV